MSGNGEGTGENTPLNGIEPPGPFKAVRRNKVGILTPLSPDQNCFALLIGVAMVFLAILACFIYYVLNVPELRTPKEIAAPVPHGMRSSHKGN